MTAHPHLHRPTGRTVGIVGAVLGLAAAGTAVGVTVTRAATGRIRAERVAGRLPEVEGVPERELRQEDPLGLAARPADRTALVAADDGVLLAVEEVGPPGSPGGVPQP